jgi:fused signal recognition particle receptor
MGILKGLTRRFDKLLGRGVIDDDLYEELEEALLEADTSAGIADSILEELRAAVRTEKIKDAEGIKARLTTSIQARLEQDASPALATSTSGPTVYIFVGVNGAGKTTSIGKLAKRLTDRGEKVLLAAGDTFRAAAIEQLEIWAERTGSEIVKSRPGADSAAVLFDAVKAAQARGCTYVLADTAGRQHTKASLMAELSKAVKVAEKAKGSKPDEILLVLDANTGQNAIRQAEMFGEAAGVTGLVISKLDGTARGGAMIGVWDRLKIPIKLIGIGEKPDDLRDFSAEEFSKQLLD